VGDVSPDGSGVPRGRKRRAAHPALFGLAALAAAIGCGEPPAPRHLVLVSVDTLRADHLGVYGAERPLTPNLDALAQQSLVFTHAYAPAPYTLPSVATLLTGRLPAEAGIATNVSQLPPEVPTLASHLAEAGWHTAAVVSSYVLRRRSGLDRGFAHYDDAVEAHEAWTTPERTAVDTTDAALAAVDAFRAEQEDDSGNLFLRVHYQDPHGPYTPPPALRERFLPAELAREDGRRELPGAAQQIGHGAIPLYQQVGDERRIGWYRAGYAAEVRHMDAELGRLLRGLASRGVYDETALLFTADHGESLGERDYWFAHGEFLSEPLVRVPFLLRVPGRDAERREEVAGLVDVVPTLAGLAGLEPPYAVRGRDLLDPGSVRSAPLYLSSRGHATAPRFALVTDEHKLLVEGRGTRRRVRLTPLGQDAPDLTGSERETLERLADELLAFHDALPKPMPPRRPLGEEQRRALQALGYVDP